MKDSLGEFFVVISIISFVAAIIYSHHISALRPGVDTLQPMGWTMVLWHGYTLAVASVGLILLIGEFRAEEP
ncbi:MAG: hypothetical protein Q4A31_03955 [Corynebacterium sp.]|uniref:hypothetical protein n=1 Tax=Corynebacterium sp. TaxID=1720 RepID=UPI0026DDA731|nr:hypothetical protein [Corynebacterium sp.]MDO4761059.1 hypothetical protein [Corynebacterium sp.]